MEKANEASTSANHASTSVQGDDSQFTPSLAPDLTKSLVYTWTIPKIKKTIKKKLTLSTEVFPLHQLPFSAMAKFHVDQDDRFRVEMLYHSVLNETYLVTLLPAVTVILKDQTGSDDNDLYQPLVSAFSHSKTYSERPMGVLINRKSLLLLPVYNRKDSVVFEFHVEPTSEMTKVHSRDGSVRFRVENFKRKLSLGLAETLTGYGSPYFYTGPEGYRVQVTVFPGGLNKTRGVGMVVYVTFLSGDNDQQLPVAFKHRATLTVLNRKEPSDHLVYGTVKDLVNANNYLLAVIPFKETKMEEVVENDTVFFQVDINAF